MLKRQPLARAVERKPYMKWEYNILRLVVPLWTGKINLQELQSILNEYGAKGWEVCGTFVTLVGLSRKQELKIVLKRNA